MRAPACLSITSFLRPAGLGQLAALALIAGATAVLADPTVEPPEAEPVQAVRLPIALANRPLTLPRFVLSPEVDLDVLRPGSAGIFTDLTGGAAFGVLDDLTIRALVLPLQLTGPLGAGFAYGQIIQTRGPSIGATYRLLRGAIEVGLDLDARVFTAPGISGFAIISGAQLRAHVTGRLRIDVAASLNITQGTVPAGAVEPPLFYEQTGNAVRLQVPVTAIYNVLEPLYVGLGTGLTVYDFSDVASTTGIPIGVFAGYSLAGTRGPILDIEPFCTFPYFFTPLARSATNTGEFDVGLSLRGFFYL